jgi:hypothetical protein
VYKSFPRLCCEMAACLNVKSAVIDGEVVYLDRDGKPQFYTLLRRRSPQQFVAFDLLSLNGKDLRNRPLMERKRMLRSVVPAGSPVLYADFVDRHGTRLYEAVCDRDLEGIVAKRKDGLYTPHETTRVKIGTRAIARWRAGGNCSRSALHWHSRGLLEATSRPTKSHTKAFPAGLLRNNTQRMPHR